MRPTSAIAALVLLATSALAQDSKPLVMQNGEAAGKRVCSAAVTYTSERPGTDKPWVGVTLYDENGDEAPMDPSDAGSKGREMSMQDTDRGSYGETFAVGGLGAAFRARLRAYDASDPLEFRYGHSVMFWTSKATDADSAEFRDEEDGSRTEKRMVYFECEL